MTQLITKPANRTNNPRSHRGPIIATEAIEIIENLNSEAEARWADRMHIDNSLTRAMVSFQANKGKAVYRWFKYKEAFSAGLIEHLLTRYHIKSGTVLDPFSGIGTTLFAASGVGLKAEGIELLPIGQVVVATKQLIDWELKDEDLNRLVYWARQYPWEKSDVAKPTTEEL